MKRIVLFALVAFASNVSAWTFKIYNKTDSAVKAYIAYGSGWCNDDEFLVKSNDKKIFDTKGCCARKYKITGVSGSLEGKVKEDTTSMCRHILTITKSEDGNISVNDEKW